MQRTGSAGTPGSAGARPVWLARAGASATAQTPAVVDAEGQLTYAQLLTGADRVATSLRTAGVGRGALVVLCLPRSVALTVASLGVLYADAAYVALDPHHPVERLRAMVADCGAQHVVTSADLIGDLGSEQLDVLADIGVVGHVTTSVASVLEPDLAYVIYTSGSTGAPKGVMVEHRGLANLVDWHQRAFDVTPGDRCSQIASPGFDATVWETWGCLANGGTLVIPPESLKTDPAALRDWLVGERIAVCFLPTPLAEVLMTLSWPADIALRFVLTGGDRLHRTPPVGLPFAVVNNYGLTEATVVSTSAPTPPGEMGTPSIGAPIDGVHIRIVDAAMNDVVPGGITDVAEGEPGELLVGGVSVARGYLNAPELTARKFFTDADETRWYRTGDVVRRRADGELDYVGRLDDQVQLRGHRIEPGEIVTALDAHPAVTQSVVLARDSAGNGQRLVAYVTTVDGTPIDELALHNHLTDALPSYMIPTAFVHLAELPVNGSGKVDVSSLPAPPEPAAAARRGRAPADELEERVAGVVAEVLGRESVGVDENFLLLGGHSLLGAQLVNLLSEMFGVDLSLRGLFDGPTPAEITAEVHRLLVEQVQALDDETAEQLIASSDLGA